MIAVSKELKQACDSESLSYKEYIVIDSTTIEIKGKMSNTAYKNTTFFGTFNLKMLEFTTENDIDYKKKTFTYWKSVNGEAFKIGSYIVTDISDNDSTEEVTVTAMDYGLKFATPYTTSLNYASGTVTLYDVLEECCTNAGVELENLTIANGDFIVDGNQFVNGEQIGTVVANIAGICGDFATINENDKLELIFYKEPDDEEVIEDYISLDDKRDTQPITCMSLGFSNIDGEEAVRVDNDLIALYGENWLRVDDNYFAYSTSKMELLIDNIFSKIKGFGYSSFVSEYSFRPYNQLGDLIYFKNKNGDKVKSIILKIDTDFDSITLSAPSITNATIDYERPDDALETAKKAQISVDKANATITEIVSNQNDQQAQITQIVTDVSGINVEIIDINNTVGEQYQNILELETSVNGINLQISQTGGSNIFNNPVGYFFDGNQTADDWTGIAKAYTNTEIKNTTVSGNAFLLQNSTLEQIVQVPNGTYTVSFIYKKLISLAECSVVVNRTVIELTGDTWKTDNLTFEVTANTIDIQLISDTNDSCYVSDLMGSLGTLVQVWSNNPNEAVNGGVKIGKGIQITSSTSNIMQKMDNDGNRIVNTNTGEVVSEFTDKSIETKEIVADKGQVGKLLIVDMGSQTWLSRM